MGEDDLRREGTASSSANDEIPAYIFDPQQS